MVPADIGPIAGGPRQGVKVDPLQENDVWANVYGTGGRTTQAATGEGASPWQHSCRAAAGPSTPQPFDMNQPKVKQRPLLDARGGICDDEMVRDKRVWWKLLVGEWFKERGVISGELREWTMTPN